MKTKPQAAKLKQNNRKQIPVKERMIVTEYKQPPRPTLGYIILSATFSTLIFLAVYFLYIINQPRDIMQFLSIFVLNLITGICGSLLSRMFTLYWEGMKKSGVFFNKQLISALIYTIIVFFGLFEFITLRYIDPNTITLAEFLQYLVSKQFMEIVAVLIGFKIVIYGFSDITASKMALGSGA